MTAQSGEIKFPAVLTRKPGGFRRAFLRWLPYYDAEAKNPVFPFAARGCADAPRLRSRMQQWVLQPVLILFGVWLAFACVVLVVDANLSIYSILLQVIGIGIGLSLLDKFVLDFAVVTSGLDAIQKDVDGGRWDLIALSDVRTQHYIKAYHAAAQIRAWRMMCRVMGFRLGLVIVGFLHIALLPPLIPERSYAQQTYDYRHSIYNPMEEVTRAIASDPANIIALILSLFAVSIVVAYYVLEPRWRVRALAAASVACASQCRKSPLELMSALGAIFGIWLGQIIISIASYILLMLIGSFGGMLLSRLNGDHFLGGLLAVYFMLVWIITRAMYLDYTNRWLTRAYDRMVKLGGTEW